MLGSKGISVRQLLDAILVVDVEATCWNGSPPEGQTSDIIEIGCCLLDTRALTPSDPFSYLVRPERSAVRPFCTELTTLTAEQVQSGIPFAEACAQLVTEFASDRRVWASWGNYDREQFARQCADLGVPYPFGKTHLNVKTLFSLFGGHPREYGMARALQIAGLPLTGAHHRGADDAWNIARLLVTILAHRAPLTADHQSKKEA
jgi:inhibitor of KinA sporulation pathway (predicted exonuclease)